LRFGELCFDLGLFVELYISMINDYRFLGFGK